MITSIGIGVTTGVYGRDIRDQGPPPVTNGIITELLFNPASDPIETEGGVLLELE
tara:strand:+ start:388 stop:552 length:165 start_codon:yes stop_codon:yes gene_type:complete